MGSVQRFTQRSYVGVNSWFNGLNSVEPWWLTWPPLLEIPPPLQLKAWEIHFKHISLSAGLGSGWGAWIETVLQSWVPDKALGHPSVKGRWRGSLTRTTHHAMTHRWEPAQAGFVTIMGMCLYMCAKCVRLCLCVCKPCEGACEHVSICVVRPWCWLSAERGWVEERRFDKCVMHAPVTAAAIREHWAVRDW